MKAKLIAALIKVLKWGLKPYNVRDTVTAGFLLRATPAGLMTFYLQQVVGA